MAARDPSKSQKQKAEKQRSQEDMCWWGTTTTEREQLKIKHDFEQQLEEKRASHIGIAKAANTVQTKLPKLHIWGNLCTMVAILE